MNRKCTTILFLCFLISSFSGVLNAQDESDDVIDLGVLYVEESWLEWDELIDRPTAFAIVLDPVELSRRSMTLAEALENVPGVSIRSFGGLGSLSTISIRGSGSENVLVLLDGVPLNPTGGSVDLSDIPLDSLERIEIIRGGEGAVYGGGAVGGVVRLTSRSVSNETSFTGRISIGSFGTATSGFTWSDEETIFHFDLAGSVGDFSFLNDNGTAFDPSDDFSDLRENNEYSAFDLRIGHNWDIDETRSLNLSTEWFQARKGIPGITTFPSTHASQSDTRLFFQGTYNDQEFSDGNLNLVLSWLRQSRHFLDEFGESTGVPIDSNRIHNRYETRAEWTGPGFSKIDVLTSGMTYSRETLDGDLTDNHSRDTFALWLRDEFYFSHGGIISGAARLDFFDGELILSPDIGLKFPINNHLTAQSNFGLDFRSPSFEELYRNEGFVIGNPELANERTLGFDIGLVQTENRFRIEGVYFNNQTEDLIDYLLISGFRWKPFNIGRVRSSGFEFSLDWLVCRDIELRGNYTRTHAIDISGDPSRNGMPLAGQPFSEIFTELRWKPDRWNIFLNWERRGSSPITSSGSRFLAPCESTGLGVGYEFDPEISVMFEIKNLFDNDISDVRGFPLPGRSFFLTVNGAF